MSIHINAREVIACQRPTGPAVFSSMTLGLCMKACTGLSPAGSQHTAPPAAAARSTGTAQQEALDGTVDVVVSVGRMPDVFNACAWQRLQDGCHLQARARLSHKNNGLPVYMAVRAADGEWSARDAS